VGDLLHEPGAGIDARVGGVEPVHVGQEHEQLGTEEHRHLGGEEVVVPERDLVGGRRVVLVDHRHDAPAEQGLERPARVEVVRAGAHVEEREQDLRGRDALLAQQVVVGAVEPALPHRAGRLELRDLVGAHGEVQQMHAARDGAGRHDDDVHPRAVQAGNLLADPRDHGQAELTRRLGDDRRTELDDGDGHAGA
jgi:hypothetical protein